MIGRAVSLAFVCVVAGAACAAETGWPSNGGDLANTRFAPQAQITPVNVKSLGGVWRTELPGGVSKASPVVQDGVMYLSAGGAAISGGAGGAVYALDAKTGKILWTFSPPSGGISALNKGVGVGNGKVFIGLANAHVAAIDAKTGKLVWEGIAGDDPPAEGQFIGAAPIFVDGKVLVGIGSGDAGIRGQVVALDGKTGKIVWRFETVPGPGKPGHASWENDAWQHGGAGVWASPAVDEALGLVIFGTGNGYPQYGGDRRPGDNLYTASVVAIDLKTGEYRWHYQAVHHEIWESDLGAPMVLFDTLVGGKPVKAVGALRMDGYLFVLDRQTGKPLIKIEERPVKQNARLKTAATQPSPVDVDQIGPNCVDPAALPPGFVPGCFWDPVDYDQPNVVLPMSTRFAPMAYDPNRHRFFVAGGAGAHWARRQPDPYFFNFSSTAPGIKEHGLFTALDSNTHRIVWQKKLPWPVAFGGGATAIDGGLVFHGQPDGVLQAYDSSTGDIVWEFQTGAPAQGPVVSYALDGKQYLAEVSNQYVWSFAAGGALPPLPAPPAPPTESTFSGRIVTGDRVAMSAELENNGANKALKFVDEFALKPQRLKVKAGGSVTWTNDGKVVHTIAARDGSWTTGPVQPGQSATVTFDKPGNYTYVDKDHLWMIGQLIVE